MRSRNNNSVDEVITKYDKLEDYMKAYIENLARQHRFRLDWLHYYRWCGIAIIKDVNTGFPSYNHWRFNGEWIRNLAEGAPKCISSFYS